MDNRVAHVMDRAEALGGDLNLTIRSLSREVHLSDRQLAVLFKRCTGYTFRRYLCQIRVGRAIDLLSDRNLMVKQVAYLTGYKSVSSLDRDFQRVYGVSPANYRTRAAVVSLG